MADPIDFTTPQSMPSQLKKAVTTHATQAKAILNNLKQSLSQDSDEQRAEERKKCAKVLKTIKKAKAEKKQAFDKKESMYRAALDFIEKQASGRPAPARASPPPGAALTAPGAAFRTSHEVELQAVKDKMSKEAEKHKRWHAKSGKDTEGFLKKVKKAGSDWVSEAAPAPAPD